MYFITQKMESSTRLEAMIGDSWVMVAQYSFLIQSLSNVSFITLRMTNFEMWQLQNSSSNQIDLIAKVEERLLSFIIESYNEKTTRFSLEMRVIEKRRAIFIWICMFAYCAS